MSRISVLGSIALLGTAFATGCIDAEAPDALAAESATESYLFGLTADELLAIKSVAQRSMSDAEWLDAHRGELRCDRYGDLCELVGEERAFETIEVGYRVALATGDVTQVRDAQHALIEAGKLELASAPAPNYRDTEDDCELGTSGGSYRLCASATATKMWPSLEMRADGHCRTQVNSFGWQAKQSDRIEGTLTARFTSGANTDVVVRGPKSITDDNRLNFAERQQSADTLTVTVECEAEDGVWTATADVINVTL